MKLPFGLCESQYFFQYYMDLNFESLTNAHIIANDVLIVGSELGPLDEQDHGRCLLQVLSQCREVSLKLNAAKCIFKAKQVDFYRHLVHTNGLSPDPRKYRLSQTCQCYQTKLTSVLYWNVPFSIFLCTPLDQQIVCIMTTNGNR